MDKHAVYGLRDAGRCWWSVGAAFMTHLFTHGVVYSYGLLFRRLEADFMVSKAATSWISSTTTGCLYLAGPLASALSLRLGNRKVAILGAILSSAGCFVTVFVRDIRLLYVTLGVTTGVGYGLIYIPAVVEVTLNFERHRAVACGVALAGAGGGAFVMGPVLEASLEHYGWRGSTLLLSGLLLNCIPCALAFRDMPLLERLAPRRVFEQEIEVVHGETGMKHIQLYTNDKGDPKESSAVDTAQLYTDDKSDAPECAVGDIAFEIKAEKEDMLPKANGNLQDIVAENRSWHLIFRIFDLLRKPSLAIWYSVQMAILFGFYSPFMLLPSKAIADGLSGWQAAWVISAMGLSTVVGRVVLGFLADTLHNWRIFIYKTAVVLTGVDIMMFAFTKSFPSMITCAVFYGFTTGFLFDVTGDYLVPFILSGAVVAGGGLLLCVALRPTHRQTKP
ncbi:MOT7-like protein [Mya arenaria]|uniref:MOT7-like protein n=1 Tax=Mya arenaria TaxID=6604 RepID=A0ABY7DR63_MYAAR|nr:MOT7-like protein [Mya arenaria]